MKDTCFYIAVPVYKVEKYLRTSLDSILAQSYHNFQIVIVDDGSPDRCGEICDEYAAKDSRIHVIHQENSGVMCARVKAIQFIRRHGKPNDYMVSVDPDDYIAPNALEVLNKSISETGSEMVFYCSNDLYPDGRTVPCNPAGMKACTITDKRELYSTVFTTYGYAGMWRKAIQISLLSDDDYAQFYHIRTGEDYLLSIDITMKCSQATFLEDILYYYRQNPDSLTNARSFDNYQSNDYFVELVWEKMREVGLWLEEDYEKHYALCKCLFRMNAWMYLKYFVSDSKKIVKLKDMLSYPVNQEMLKRITKKDWDLYLMREEHFHILCLLGNLLGCARFIYRQLKRLHIRTVA